MSSLLGQPQCSPDQMLALGLTLASLVAWTVAQTVVVTFDADLLQLALCPAAAERPNKL